MTAGGEIRIGLVGAGIIAGVHAGNLAQLDGVRLAAVCDVDEDRARRLAGPAGATTYADAARMLDDEPLDAVFVCLPPFAHGDVVERAARAGIHVYLEKPVGLSLDAASRVADVVEDAGVITSVGYMWRYAPAAERARSLRGPDGSAMLLGRMLNGPNTPAWSFHKKLSGGLLVEFATHLADLLRYLGGEVTRVSGAATDVVPGPAGRGPDSAVISLHYANGSVGALQTTWANTSMVADVRLIAPDAQLELDLTTERLHGSAAGMAVDYTSPAPAGVQLRGFTGGPSWYLAATSFVDAIRLGDPGPVRCSFRDGVRTLALTLAADEAAGTGRAVTVPTL